MYFFVLMNDQASLPSPPQYVTIIMSQVMKPILKISALWGGGTTTSLETLKKQFI